MDRGDVEKPEYFNFEEELRPVLINKTKIKSDSIEKIFNPEIGAVLEEVMEEKKSGKGNERRKNEKN